MLIFNKPLVLALSITIVLASAVKSNADSLYKIMTDGINYYKSSQYTKADTKFKTAIEIIERDARKYIDISEFYQTNTFEISKQAYYYFGLTNFKLASKERDPKIAQARYTLARQGLGVACERGNNTSCNALNNIDARNINNQVEMANKIFDIRTDLKRRYGNDLQDIDTEVSKEYVYLNKVKKCDNLFTNKKYNKAMTCCEEAIKLRSDRADILTKLSSTYVILNKYEAALEAAYKAVKLESDNALAHFLMSYSAIHLGQYDIYKNGYELLLGIDKRYADEVSNEYNKFVTLLGTSEALISKKGLWQPVSTANKSDIKGYVAMYKTQSGNKIHYKINKQDTNGNTNVKLAYKTKDGKIIIDAMLKCSNGKAAIQSIETNKKAVKEVYHLNRNEIDISNDDAFKDICLKQSTNT